MPDDKFIRVIAAFLALLMLFLVAFQPKELKAASIAVGSGLGAEVIAGILGGLGISALSIEDVREMAVDIYANSPARTILDSMSVLTTGDMMATRDYVYARVGDMQSLFNTIKGYVLEKFNFDADTGALVPADGKQYVVSGDSTYSFSFTHSYLEPTYNIYRIPRIVSCWVGDVTVAGFSWEVIESNGSYGQPYEAKVLPTSTLGRFYFHLTYYDVNNRFRTYGTYFDISSDKGIPTSDSPMLSLAPVNAFSNAGYINDVFSGLGSGYVDEDGKLAIPAKSIPSGAMNLVASPSSLFADVSEFRAPDIPLPTALPTDVPLYPPDVIPTTAPTEIPGEEVEPTATPTEIPAYPTEAIPTAVPTTVPTSSPGVTPTPKPTETPMYPPDEIPATAPPETPGGEVEPTATPTEIPGGEVNPTATPTEIPTEIPGGEVNPTATPTEVPGGEVNPTATPTDVPSYPPGETPTELPTDVPGGGGITTEAPTEIPSPPPSEVPTEIPIENPDPVEVPEVEGLGDILDWLNDFFRNLLETLKRALEWFANLVFGSGELDISELSTRKDQIITVFPFCIPFDFIKLVQTFNVTPEAPRFEIDFTGTVLEIGKTNFVLDLKEFESIAQVIRFFSFTAFAAALMVNTRNFMKW